jgi:hypothetical protein
MKFKKQSLQNEDQLTICFQGIVNIGGDHWSPFAVNAAMAATQIEEGATQGDLGGTEGAEHGEEVEEVTPSPSCGKRAPRYVQGSGKKAKTANAVLIQEAVTSMASSANEYATRKVGKYTIEEVMNVVIACGAEYGSNEHYIATELFVKKEQRDMFMTFPTDEIRFNWLSRKYNDRHAK